MRDPRTWRIKKNPESEIKPSLRDHLPKGDVPTVECQKGEKKIRTMGLVGR